MKKYTFNMSQYTQKELADLKKWEKKNSMFGLVIKRQRGKEWLGKFMQSDHGEDDTCTVYKPLNYLLFIKLLCQ
jgi:hypothetical protein